MSSKDQEPQSSQPSQSEQSEQTERRKPTSELWGPWIVPGEDGQGPNYRAVSGTQFKKPMEQVSPADPEYTGIDPQFAYREHVSGPLAPQPASGRNELRPYISPAPPPQAPGYPPVQGYPPLPYYPDQRQGYPPIQSHPPIPSYQGYASWPTGQPGQPGQPGSAVPPGYAPYSPYNGYLYPYPYPYSYAPPRPKRDGYLFGVGIASFIGSILVILAGLISLFLLSFLPAVSANTLSSSQKFMGAVTFVAFALVGLIGGGFGLYHSIRSVFARKPSADFSMPTFWLFVALYVVVIGVGYVLHMRGQDVTNLQLTAVLILLAGLFPALAVLALGNRRLRFPKGARWPTSWRRFTLAIVSGATMGVLIAGALELVFQVALRVPYLCLNTPDAQACQDPNVYNLLLIAVAVIAPLVEEAVKPLAVIILIGRVRSAAEAFVLGLACGIGFDLIETSGYISADYTNWLGTALIRTGAGLLHGFGAAMVALGWYYLVHPGKKRVLKALGCWLYAVAQHALWNGSWGLVLLPAPFGQFFNNLMLTIGSVTLPYYVIINIGEALFILGFFLYITNKIRAKSTDAPRAGASPARTLHEAQS